MVALIFVVSAVAVVAVLMLIMMRVRWNDGSRPGWEPDVAPRSESLPRAYGTLIVVGYLVLVPGVVLAAVFRITALGIVCLVLFAATWVTRNVLIRWRDANTSVRKVDAVAAPLGFVAAMALANHIVALVVSGGLRRLPGPHVRHELLGVESASPICVRRMNPLDKALSGTRHPVP